jgi:hypothetical protein
MLLNLQGNVEKKSRARKIQVDFNSFTAQQRKHVEMMIRYLVHS